jgi:hypothetical protein
MPHRKRPCGRYAAAEYVFCPALATSAGVPENKVFKKRRQLMESVPKGDQRQVELRAMEAILLDASKWPVVVVRVARPPTDEQLDRFLDNYHAQLQARTGPYAIVLDLRTVSDMPPAQRKRLTASMRTNSTLDRCRGCGMVFSSAALRMLLTAIMWVFKPKHPTEIFTNDGDALEWAFARLREAPVARRVTSIGPGR